jgi:hypothetical protein
LTLVPNKPRSSKEPRVPESISFVLKTFEKGKLTSRGVNVSHPAIWQGSLEEMKWIKNTTQCLFFPKKERITVRSYPKKEANVGHVISVQMWRENEANVFLLPEHSGWNNKVTCR